MKTTFRNRLNLSTFTLTCVLMFSSVFESPSQQLKKVSNLPDSGTFRLISLELEDGQSPPFPFDPYGGVLPVYEMTDLPGQFIVADSPDDYQQLQSENSFFMSMNSLEDDGPPVPGPGSGDPGVSVIPILYTNAPETLLFDTMSSSSNGMLPSWRDVRTSPMPSGMALGILIQTNYPFELTRIEAEVVFDNPSYLPDTEFEVGFFRGTNQFQYGMYVDPEYVVSDFNGTLTKSLTNLSNGNWLLTVEMPSYGWGTNRIVTIRTVPNSSGPMAKMSLIACPQTIPGITAYSSDNTTSNMVQVALPKIKVWRRLLSPILTVSYETSITDMQLDTLPGYQLGSAANPASPFVWQTDDLHNWRTIVDTREGAKFFLMRPDPTP